MSFEKLRVEILFHVATDDERESQKIKKLNK